MLKHEYELTTVHRLFPWGIATRVPCLPTIVEEAKWPIEGTYMRKYSHRMRIFSTPPFPEIGN